MHTSDADKWVEHLHDQFYDTLVIRGNSYINNDAVLRNHIEDCVSETFELAWKKYRKLVNHPYILGWLTKTLYNKIDNLNVKVSTRNSRTHLSIDYDKGVEIIDKDAWIRVEEFFIREERQETLALIVEQLTDKETEVYEDYFVNGIRAKDIQSRRGMSLEAVRATIRRIRAKAKKISRKNIFCFVPVIGTLLFFRQIMK